MKKTIVALFILFSFSATAQTNVVVQITLDTTTYKQLLNAIDANIDSKSLSNNILSLLQKNAKLVKVDADKPKNK